METPLYSTLNWATCVRDERAINTLGPYACLLFYTIQFPPADNAKKMKEMATEKRNLYPGDKAQCVTLYRGRGLPKAAIKTYQELLEAEGRRR